MDGDVSNWKSVLSGDHNDLLLFVIYINGLEGGVTSKILKFAYDTELFEKVKGNGHKQHLQDDIDKFIR